MTNRTIQLSHKLVIESTDDAKIYFVERWYAEYFEELNNQLRYLGVHDGGTTNIPNQHQLNSSLESIFGNKFGFVLQRSNPFVDLNDIPIELESVKVVTKTFIRNAINPTMFLFLITKPLELIESLGTILIMRNPVSTSENTILSVQLDNLTTIYSIQE